MCRGYGPTHTRPAIIPTSLHERQIDDGETSRYIHALELYFIKLITSNTYPPCEQEHLFNMSAFATNPMSTYPVDELAEMLFGNAESTSEPGVGMDAFIQFLQNRIQTQILLLEVCSAVRVLPLM